MNNFRITKVPINPQINEILTYVYEVEDDDVFLAVGEPPPPPQAVRLITATSAKVFQIIFEYFIFLTPELFC